jgi:hypothetical protein
MANILLWAEKVIVAAISLKVALILFLAYGLTSGAGDFSQSYTTLLERYTALALSIICVIVSVMVFFVSSQMSVLQLFAINLIPIAVGIYTSGSSDIIFAVLDNPIVRC